MLAYFKKKLESEPKGLVSLVISPNGIAFASIADPNFKAQESNINNLQYKSFGFVPCGNRAQLEDCLWNIVEENGLQHYKCNWILHPDYYRLLLVDTPPVTVNEYKSAVRWQLKDMIDFSINEATIDIFPPAKDLKEYEKKLYVVAAKESFLTQGLEIMRNCQLKPNNVDIFELAVRNLLTAINGNNTTGYLHKENNKNILIIIKEGNLHFVRHIASGELNIELKRTFNYYQNKLKQSLPKKLFFTAKDASIRQLAQELSIKLDTFELGNLNLPEHLDQEAKTQCYIAIGGILRKESQ